MLRGLLSFDFQNKLSEIEYYCRIGFAPRQLRGHVEGQARYVQKGETSANDLRTK